MALSITEATTLTDMQTKVNQLVYQCKNLINLMTVVNNTGILDISTHNEDTTAHSTDASFVRYVNATTPYKIGVGPLNSVASAYVSTYPLVIGKNPNVTGTTDKGQSIEFVTETGGLTAVNAALNRISLQCFETDANGNQASAVTTSRHIQNIFTQYYTRDYPTYTNPDLQGNFKNITGTLLDTAGEVKKKTSYVFGCSNGTRVS